MTVYHCLSENAFREFDLKEGNLEEICIGHITGTQHPHGNCIGCIPDYLNSQDGLSNKNCPFYSPIEVELRVKREDKKYSSIIL